MYSNSLGEIRGCSAGVLDTRSNQAINQAIPANPTKILRIYIQEEGKTSLKLGWLN